ncbi:MAG TPA: alpha/beta hydrolase [Chloroflexia bacterium]|nr:alpha/beta hydrolase [Chloroflexia bacterium]
MEATTNKTLDNPVPVRGARRGKRVMRRIALGFGIVICLIASLALAGTGYEAIAAGGDAKAYPPPGQLVDVGGYRLHIQCMGSGSPTVVLDAGLGGSSLDWNLVQGNLSQTSRVCAYDRAGMGWSDAGPQPRTPDHIARELYTLLTNAHIEGPYVLVGHSLGGKNIRMFALQHPDLVAGMVLVDARSEYVDEHTSPSEATAFQQGIATQGNLYGVTRHLGLIRLFGAGMWGNSTIPEKIRTEMALLSTTQRSIDTQTAEAAGRAEDDTKLDAAPSLGNLPLFVLASEQNMTGMPAWPEAQKRQAALSTNSHLIVAKGSGHYIQLDQPAVVLDAVRQVVVEARSH